MKTILAALVALAASFTPASAATPELTRPDGRNAVHAAHHAPNAKLVLATGRGFTGREGFAEGPGRPLHRNAETCMEVGLRPDAAMAKLLAGE